MDTSAKTIERNERGPGFLALLMHHGRKDLRRMRWWLTGWGALLVVQAVAMSAWFATIPGGDWWWALSLPMAGTPVIQVVVLALAVAVLMQQESTADRDAYWLTLPIAPGPLLVAKVLFALLFFVAIPVLWEAGIFLLQGFPLDLVNAACGEVAFRHLVLVAFCAAVAALTPDLLRFVTWLLILLAGYAVLLLVLATLEDGIRSGPILLFAGGSAGDVTPTLRAGAIAIVGGLAVFALQYLTRRRAFGVLTAIAGLALCLGAAHFLPMENGGSGTARWNAGDDTAGGPELSLRIRDAEWVSGEGGTARGERLLRAPLQIEALGDRVFLIPERARSSLRPENRSPVVFDPVAQSQPDGADLVAGADVDRFVELLRLDRAGYLAWRDRSGELEVELTLRQGHFRAVTELALREGAYFRERGSRVVLRRINSAPGALQIDVDVRRTRLLLSPDSGSGWREKPPGGEEMVFFLVHPESGENVVPTHRQVSPMVWPRNGRRLLTERISLTFGEPWIGEVENDEDVTPEPFRDDDWMEEAVLVGFRISDGERFRRGLIAEAFNFPEWD